MKIFNLLSKFKNTGQTSLIVFALFVIAGCSQSPQVTEQEDLTGGRGELISIDVRETFDENLTEASLSLEEQIKNSVSFQLADGVELGAYTLDVYDCLRGYNPVGVPHSELKLVADFKKENSNFFDVIAGGDGKSAAQALQPQTWTSGCKVDVTELEVNNDLYKKAPYDGDETNNLDKVIWDKDAEITLFEYSADLADYVADGKKIKVEAQAFVYDTTSFAASLQDGVPFLDNLDNINDEAVLDHLYVFDNSSDPEEIILRIGQSDTQDAVETDIVVAALEPTTGALSAPAVSIPDEDNIFLTRSTITLNSLSVSNEKIVDCHKPGITLDPDALETCGYNDLKAKNAFVRSHEDDRGVLEISLDCIEPLVKNEAEGTSTITCDNQLLTNAKVILFAGLESHFQDGAGQIFSSEDEDLTGDELNIDYDKMVRMIELAEADALVDQATSLRTAGKLFKVGISVDHLVGLDFDGQNQQVDQSPREKAIQLIAEKSLQHSLQLNADVCMLSEKKLQNGGFCMRFTGLAGEANEGLDPQFNFGSGGYIMCTYSEIFTDSTAEQPGDPRTFAGSCQRLDNFTKGIYVNYSDPS